MLHRVLSQSKQVRRQLIELNIATNKKVIKPYMKVKGNNNNLFFSPDGSSLDLNSNGLKTANTILKDGSDLIGAPARLINNIQQNLIVYLILIAFILLFILILYCIIRYHCSTGWKIFTKRGVRGELATIIKAKKKKPPLTPLRSTNQTDQPSSMEMNSNEMSLMISSVP